MAPMLYCFGEFELDMAKFELRSKGAVRAVEPQVFALLALLVENRERLVPRDEIIEKVWGGRIVSDAAVDSRIKSARKALGDDGRTQRFIKTIPRLGFRFVADARATAAQWHDSIDTGVAAPQADPLERPSIAVLPFSYVGPVGPCSTIAEALPHELIGELARLRWLFVTARGSSFRLRSHEADIGDVGRLLGVRYALSGTVHLAGRRLAVSVELVDTRDGGVIWGDRLGGSLDDVHRIREDIRTRILAELEIRIPMHEAELARCTVTEDLDAWSAYHLGLQHMFRFNRADSRTAASLFRQAISNAPGFARAHAGLSFIHFQAAFMHYTEDRAGETTLARRFAERALELDPIDPFVNFTMGRSFWLEGDLQGSLVWLERATSISPNYAQGIYARAWSETLAGKCAKGREHIDLAMRLSPIDPLYYAMLGTRAFTHMVQGEDAEAAAWAERAARSPGAHVLIALIAAVAHSLHGDAPRAGYWAADVRARQPAMSREDFLRAFPIDSDAARLRIANALVALGF